MSLAISAARLAALLLAAAAAARTLPAQEARREPGEGITRGPGSAAAAGGPRLANYGGFVGGDVRFGSIGGEFAAFVSAEAALVIGNRVYVGIRGGGLATDTRGPLNGSGVRDTLRMGHGGLLIGYTSPLLPRLNVSVDALLGAGTVGTSGTATKDDDEVFVFEPSATLDLKLAGPARLGVGASYRFIGGASIPGVADSDLRGLSGIARIRLGRF